MLRHFRGGKAMQLLESGLKVEEYELLICNFSDASCLGFGIQEHIDLGIKTFYDRVLRNSLSGATKLHQEAYARLSDWEGFEKLKMHYLEGYRARLADA
uniref:60S ribosomal protein L11 n=1 Tax=Tanacetum cinerariifolium TaxID=118510 RepID=A0A6L2M706_TANCI|nr:60S ribosomal protein L11 [Tanacetum cinerariifolium]